MQICCKIWWQQYLLKFIEMRESCGFIIGMELEGGGALKRYLYELLSVDG